MNDAITLILINLHLYPLSLPLIEIIVRWMRIECFNRRNLPCGYDVKKFVSVLKDNTTDKILSNKDKVEELVHNISVNEINNPKKKKKRNNKRKAADESFLGHIKENAVDWKKAKVLTGADRIFADAYLKYQSFSKEKLKGVLRWNGAVDSDSTKDALLTRVIDGQCRGK